MIRSSPLGFTATKHAIKRIRGRMGLPKRAAMRAIERAVENGSPASAYTCEFGEFLLNIESNNAHPADRTITHDKYIFLFAEDRVITVLHIPPEYRKATPKKDKI